MKNHYFIHEAVGWIEMNCPKEKRSVFTIIDAADVALMPKGSISLSSAGYALYWDGKTHQRLHRLIMGFPESDIDHRYGDKLDNRRSKLREATTSQNMGNQQAQIGGTSEYKGVSWHKATGKWRVQIKGVNRERIYLGLFTDEIEAAKAYDRAAIEFFGEFAKLNFPKEGVLS